MSNTDLKDHHDTMVNELIPKGLITVQIPHVSDPVSIYIEAYRLPKVLKELLDSEDVIVHETITIPQFNGHDVVLQPYSIEEILNGDFKISS